MSYQIDICGFDCHPSHHFVHFPWNCNLFAANAFFPLKKHKSIHQKLPKAESITNDTTSVNRVVVDDTPHWHIPNDPSCLLSNLHGADFMTPKASNFKRKFDAYNHPPCHTSSNSAKPSSKQQQELERQLSFCDASQSIESYEKNYRNGAKSYLKEMRGWVQGEEFLKLKANVTATINNTFQVLHHTLEQ